MAEHFASGNWHVKEGKEAEFVERWTEFLQRTRKDHPGLESATLIRDEGDPRHFLSFAGWDDPQARAAWRQTPEFAEGFRASRELCDDFYGGDYQRAVVI
ncbi:MAG: antibiotic biosynthesis monooxygenase [Actinomycetota bacterium]|nr:antibiotic biosynthesis monooxygenase [Actinomycetota bacterium]